MKLSAREAQVLDLLQLGLTNKEIGLQLGISPHTVRDHVSGMLRRHGLKGRTELAAIHTQKTIARQFGITVERRATGDRRSQQLPNIP